MPAAAKKSGILNFRVSNDLKEESKNVLEKYKISNSRIYKLSYIVKFKNNSKIL